MVANDVFLKRKSTGPFEDSKKDVSAQSVGTGKAHKGTPVPPDLLGPRVLLSLQKRHHSMRSEVYDYDA